MLIDTDGNKLSIIDAESAFVKTRIKINLVQILIVLIQLYVNY